MMPLVRTESDNQSPVCSSASDLLQSDALACRNVSTSVIHDEEKSAEVLFQKVDNCLRLTTTRSPVSDDVDDIQECLMGPRILRNIESDAKAIASNLDEVLRDLRGSLHGMSDLTVESSRCYAETISSTCDAADAAVKNTYALLAKVEELGESMNKLRKVAQQIKEIKQIVDSFEVQFISGLL